MAQPAPFLMPGYSWDGHRFFKTLPGATSTFKAPPGAESAAHDDDHDPGAAEGANKKPRREFNKGRSRAVEPLTSRLRDLASLAPGEEHKLKRDLACLTWQHYRSSTVIYPDCLLIDDSITAISFDHLDRNVVRIGTQGGSIATGNLSRSSDGVGTYYPNDEFGWRTNWYLGSSITSLTTRASRFLATCLGPPAQAVVATTTDSISLASVTLSPRKTALWTSALSSSLLALGCDRKVLISRDPSRASMEGYTTGGKNGGGAVFALELGQNIILAGTRKGHVKIFDPRSSRSSVLANDESGEDRGTTRPEMQLALSSSITHLRLLNPTSSPASANDETHLDDDAQQVLVATLDGRLQTHDLRFVLSNPNPTLSPRPLIDFKGHVNSFTRDLGLATTCATNAGGPGEGDFVALAGQDRFVRIWSLRTGRLVPPSTSKSNPDSLLGKKFDEPVKALAFGPEPPTPTYASRRFNGKAQERDAKEEVLWVADGGGLEVFRLGGATG